MLKYLLAAAVLCGLFSEAHARPQARQAHPDCNIVFPCEGVATSVRGQRVVKAMGGFGTATKTYRPRVARVEAPRRQRLAQRVASTIAHTTENYSHGIVAPLAAKVAEIQSSCGSRVISAVRHSYIAGTRRISLHASGKAVDMAGNPSCIYSHLAGWSGGYSTDYGRVAHVHISYDASGGREMGIRFAHGGGRHHTRRAHRHQHRRYAGR